MAQAGDRSGGIPERSERAVRFSVCQEHEEVNRQSLQIWGHNVSSAMTRRHGCRELLYPLGYMLVRRAGPSSCPEFSREQSQIAHLGAPGVVGSRSSVGVEEPQIQGIQHALEWSAVGNPVLK